jgi:hypothetical protein
MVHTPTNKTNNFAFLSEAFTNTNKPYGALEFLPQPYGVAQSIIMKRTLTKQPYGVVEFFTATLRGCTINYDEKNVNKTTLRGC